MPERQTSLWQGIEGRQVAKPLQATLPYYSTVVGLSTSVGKDIGYKPTKGFVLRMSVELVFSNLWTSPYSSHQQELFSIICKRHDEEGYNFKQISTWLNLNGYRTPRGKMFQENHVWSIYMKKRRSILRFSREYDPVITDMRIDVVDYTPQTD